MNQSNNEVNQLNEGLDQEIKLNFNVPVIHQDKFAAAVGLSSGVIGGWVDNGYIPTLKIGKYRMINLVQFTKQLGAAS